MIRYDTDGKILRERIRAQLRRTAEADGVEVPESFPENWRMEYDRSRMLTTFYLEVTFITATLNPHIDPFRKAP